MEEENFMCCLQHLQISILLPFWVLHRSFWNIRCLVASATIFKGRILHLLHTCLFPSDLISHAEEELNPLTLVEASPPLVFHEHVLGFPSQKHPILWDFRTKNWDLGGSPLDVTSSPCRDALMNLKANVWISISISISISSRSCKTRKGANMLLGISKQYALKTWEWTQKL